MLGVILNNVLDPVPPHPAIDPDPSRDQLALFLLRASDCVHHTPELTTFSRASSLSLHLSALAQIRNCTAVLTLGSADTLVLL
eukprot:3012432-Rhodomonas_salina.1